MKYFLFALSWLIAIQLRAAVTLADFEGTWLMAEASTDQGSLSEEQRAALVMTFSGTSYSLTAAGNVIAKGRATVDGSKSPAHMTVKEEEGQNVGRELAGIAEKTPDGWKALYAMDGGERPSLFGSPISGQVLIRYVRKPGSAPKASKTLKALLVTGGCCHEYDRQALTLMEGISKRANITFTLVRDVGADGTQHRVSAYQKDDWAVGYDVVIHNECYADEKDPAWLERIVAPHRAGVPAVVIHCAMHCYRAPTNEWFRFLGVTSRSHGSHFAYPMTNVKPEHPVMIGFPAVWQTPKEELYIIEKVEKEATPLATGYSPETKKGEANVWVHQYGKARVFGTTVGHYNSTMADPVYLDLVTRGTLWAIGKLGEDGKPMAGYGPLN